MFPLLFSLAAGCSSIGSIEGVGEDFQVLSGYMSHLYLDLDRRRPTLAVVLSADPDICAADAASTLAQLGVTDFPEVATPTLALSLVVEDPAIDLTGSTFVGRGIGYSDAPYDLQGSLDLDSASEYLRTGAVEVKEHEPGVAISGSFDGVFWSADGANTREVQATFDVSHCESVEVAVEQLLDWWLAESGSR